LSPVSGPNALGSCISIIIKNIIICIINIIIFIIINIINKLINKFEKKILLLSLINLKYIYIIEEKTLFFKRLKNIKI
jgi:hypothetical protein